MNLAAFLRELTTLILAKLQILIFIGPIATANAHNYLVIVFKLSDYVLNILCVQVHFNQRISVI